MPWRGLLLFAVLYHFLPTATRGLAISGVSTTTGESSNNPTLQCSDTAHLFMYPLRKGTSLRVSVLHGPAGNAMVGSLHCLCQQARRLGHEVVYCNCSHMQMEVPHEDGDEQHSEYYSLPQMASQTGARYLCTTSSFLRTDPKRQMPVCGCVQRLQTEVGITLIHRQQRF